MNSNFPEAGFAGLIPAVEAGQLADKLGTGQFLTVDRGVVILLAFGFL